MSRKQRRALARFLGRAAPKPDPLADRVNELALENAEMRLQLQALRSHFDEVPGVVEGRKDWFVHVGGEKVELKAIPPIEWVRSLEQLPSYLYSFAIERIKNPGEGMSDEKIAETIVFARRWITACAVAPDSVNLDRLTLPEAQHAVAHIAVLNGVTDYLRAWFRKRLAGVAGATPDSQSVRATPQQPAGDQPN